MKKILAFILSFLLLAMPLSAKAAPSPLSRESSAASILNEENVQMISYKAYIKADSRTAQTIASIVLKNTSDEEVKIMAGLPSHINQGTVKINNLQVIMDGVRQRISTRRNRTKAEDAGELDLPPNWITWTVSLKPKEAKVIDIEYTTENKKADNGTIEINIPLEYISLWYSTPQIVEVTVDVGNGLPYMFEPNPSVLPHEYDEKGKLTWIYENNFPSGNIQLFYRPVNQLAADYITTQAQGSKSVSSIVKAFTNKSYSQVIDQIDQYIETREDDTLKNELMFLKAVSYHELLQTAEAVDIYEQLESQPIFGELEGTFKNKIIYDKYNHMKSLMTDENTLYEYLNSSKNFIMDNAIFIMWVEEELNQLSSFIKIPEKEHEPSEAETLPQETEDKEEKKENEKLVRSVTIGNYEISVETLFLGILAIVIILTTIISRRRKRRKSRYYYFH